MSIKTFKYIPLTVGLAVALPNGAAPQTFEEQIIQQLQNQGFSRIEIQRTLLGRVRIEARSPTLERELVFNPATGEILRDFWESSDDDDDERANTPRISNPSSSNSKSDRNDRDDDDDDENSGSGSRNSGSNDDDDDRDDDDEDDDDRDDDDEDDDDRDDDDEDDDDRDDDDDDDDD